jgi:hypothetical protein
MIAVRVCVLPLLLLAIAHGSAWAQTWEMSALAGFTPSVSLARQASDLTDVSIRGGFTFGFQGARFLTPRWAIEGVFAQQSSALEVATAAGADDLYGITIAQLHANLVYQFADAGTRLQPFVFGGAGATFFGARDLDSETKASFGIGGGVKYFPWPAIGLRGQVKYKPSLLNGDSEGDFCSPFTYCQTWLSPIELAGGVVIRF